MESVPGEVAAVWVFCDPLTEIDTWATTLPLLRQEGFFTWKANLRPEGWDARSDAPDLSRQVKKRVATHEFQALSYYESTHQELQNTEPAVRQFIGELNVRSSGFACAVGNRGELGDTWVRSSQAMEQHFSLSRDFKNSPDLESQRRSMVSLYVSSSIQAGLYPCIPLNRHPYAGFTIFCPTREYSETLQRLSIDAEVLEGKAAETQISGFIEQGGDLAYL
ncbi:hypothetical protein ACF09C_10240 [Streptomyces sp. NPDC014870]|uniref:hypothetical protein n=1 Tax=Streptomyces sp. NPDC014870 TaxID=3364925 RepID=UPI0036FF6960